MNQNETIRINIDIDDTDLRNLNTVIADLQTTLNNLDSTLSTSISQVQNTVREVAPLETAFVTMNSTLDILQRTLSISTMSLQNIDKNIEFLTGTSRAFTSATGLSTVAMNKKTTSMVLATAAATGLKWALKAIPFVGVIALAGSLFSSLGRLIFNTEDATEETENYRHELDRLRSSMDKTSSGAEASRNSFDGNMGALRRNSDTVDHHIDTLDRLSRQTDLSNEERGKMIHSVAALNDHFDDLNLTIDEETGALSESVGALHERARVSNTLTGVIEGQSFAIEHMNDLIDEEIQLNQELEEAKAIRDRITAAQERYTEATQLASDATADQDEINKAIAESHEMLNELREEGILIGESEYEMFLDTATALEMVDDKVTELTNSQEENATNRIETAKEIAEAEEMIAIATAESVEAQVISFEDLSEAQRDVAEELSRTFNNYVDQLRGSNGKIRVDNEFTADHWRETMEHNQKVMGEWADNVEGLSGRVSDEMLDYIRTLGPEHAHLVQDMVDMSDAELQDLEGVFKNNCQVAAQAALAGIDDANIPIEVANLIFESERTMNDAIRGANFGGLGLNLAEGLRDGIKDGETLVGTGAAELAREAERAIREESETNSPSKVFHRIGGDLVSGLNQGIEALQSQPTTTLQKLATTMQRVYNSANRDYITIGRDIMSGLNQGLLNGENIVMATTNRIANNITRTMRKALDINSPSRVMREQIGRQIPAGVAAGIDKYADSAIDSMHDLGDNLTKINFPNINDIINTASSLSLSGATSGSGTNNDYSVVNNNQGLFEGANINWSGEQDIRRTMEKIAWVTKQEQARLWR